MSIQEMSCKVLYVKLPQEPELGDELEKLIRKARDRNDYDVVLDMSGADILTSSSVIKLFRLRKGIGDCQRNMVLCNVSKVTLGLFIVQGVEEFFTMMSNKESAFAFLDKKEEE